MKLLRDISMTWNSYTGMQVVVADTANFHLLPVEGISGNALLVVVVAITSSQAPTRMPALTP